MEDNNMRERLPEEGSIIALTPYGGMCIVLNNTLDKLKKIQQCDYSKYDDNVYKAISKCINVVKQEQRWAKRNIVRINRR